MRADGDIVVHADAEGDGSVKRGEYGKNEVLRVSCIANEGDGYGACWEG